MADAVVEGALRPEQIVASNYRVIERLGGGGFGDVYRGENRTLAQRVVIKKLKGGARGAAAEEARMMASLNHPNVVHVYAYDEVLDCLVMEFLDGETLVDYAERKAKLKQFGLLEAIRVCEEVAVALRAVHAAGLVHRDVKPENVMVAEGLEWVKLIDMGTALRVGRTVNPPAGTPEFCPPEQFDGNIPAHPANDMYALGVMLFNLVSRQLPFSGEPHELLKQHFYSEPPSLHALMKGEQPLPPEIDLVLEQADELVARLMSKDAAKRPDARSVASELSNLESRFSNEKTQTGVAMPLALTEIVAPGAGVKRTSTTVLPKKAPGMVAPTTSEALASIQKPKKSNRKWLFAALLLLLLLGGGLAVSLSPGERAGVRGDDAGTVATNMPVPPPHLEKPPDETPLAPLPELKPEPKPEVKPPPLVVKQPKTNIQVEKAPPCTFDDRFREYARRTRSQLREMIGDSPKFSAADDKLSDAIISEDCRKANDALSVMRQLADAQ